MTAHIVTADGPKYQQPRFPPIQDHGSSPFVRELLIGRIRELGKIVAEQQSLIDEHEISVAGCRDRIYQAQSQIDEITAFLEFVVAKDELPQIISGLPF